jgi:predicted transcriptional regulator
MVDEFVGRVFGGSARPLVLGLVKDKKLSPEDLKAIERILKEEP